MNTRPSARHWRSLSEFRFAFTLLELLVVVAIIGVLAGMIFPITNAMQKKGRMVRELSAGRQLMTAYTSAMSQNDGVLLKGYDKSIQSVSMPSGKTLSGEMCCRYPWRLAPFLSEQIEGMFLVNDNHKQTESLAVDSFEYQYRASLNPAFGINAYCIGGYDDGSGSGFFGTDCVTRIGGTSHSSKLIVFCTARMKQAGTEITPGHFLVTPPKLWRTKWTLPFKESSPSSSYGNVDPRWDGRAICAFLDGHVELLDETELTDMRHWSNTAADNNDRDFAVPR